MAIPVNKTRLTILHTNDFHNRLSAASAHRIAQIFMRTPEPKLLVDAGDAGGSSNITYRPGGEPILTQMSRLGYSTMTVGNRDFHVSRTGFRAKLCLAEFPILCANIRPARAAGGADSIENDRPLAASNSDDEPDLRSYILRDIGDWKVLIVGFMVAMVTERMWERKLSAYVFEPPVPSAARIVPSLRSRWRPDLTIALTHIGLRLDRELAASVPDIDLIVGGHSHELLPMGERTGESLIVQAGSHGRNIGIVEADKSDSPDGRPHLSARIEAL